MEKPTIIEDIKSERLKVIPLFTEDEWSKITTKDIELDTIKKEEERTTKK